MSEQRYEVVRFLDAPKGNVMIREWPSTAPKGKRMAEQRFDTSLLFVDNSGPKLLSEMLPRFSR